MRIKEVTANMPDTSDRHSAQYKERQKLYTDKQTLLRLARELYKEKWFSIVSLFVRLDTQYVHSNATIHANLYGFLQSFRCYH